MGHNIAWKLFLITEKKVLSNNVWDLNSKIVPYDR